MKDYKMGLRGTNKKKEIDVIGNGQQIAEIKEDGKIKWFVGKETIPQNIVEWIEQNAPKHARSTN